MSALDPPFRIERLDGAPPVQRPRRVEERPRSDPEDERRRRDRRPPRDAEGDEADDDGLHVDVLA